MEIVAEMPDSRSKDSSPPVTPRRSPAGASSSVRRAPPVCRSSIAGFEPLDILAGLVRAGRAGARPHAARREHVSALRHARRKPPRTGTALARVPADRRTLARHRARAERQPPPARRVGPRRRAAPLHDRPRLALGLRAAAARAAMHLRRHHGRYRNAGATAGSSAPSASPTTRSAPAWFRSEGTCRIWHQYGGRASILEGAP